MRSVRVLYLALALCAVCAAVTRVSPVTAAGLGVRDDSKGPEPPDTAPGLPKIPQVPFLGSDELPFSPPVYPSPNTTGAGWWDEAVSRARADVAKLNVTDLVALVTGTGYGKGRCVGNTAPVPAIEFPGLCLQDSPTGLRGVDRTTVFPDAITAAATFSKSLMRRRGSAMGAEFRRKGANAQLGPMINLMRAPTAGRNFEGFGADPYVNGEAAYYTTLGIQGRGVQATLKHFLANEQEHFRNTGSSNLDERTEREMYLHPFMRGIQAGAVSVMCSYNLVNNSWACQNAELLNGRLKTELGFQGYVISDWGAQHSGVASALAGLDMTMPGGTSCCEMGVNGSFWGANLTEAVANGTVPKTRLDDMATRVLAAYYFLHQDDGYPRANFNFFDITDPATNDAVDATEGHAHVAREVAAAGTVLLKNERAALPLRRPRKIALVGTDAAPLARGPNYWSDRIGWPYGTLAQGWGSGSSDYSYLISPYEAMQRRAREDRTAVNWSLDDFDLRNAQKVANYTDAAFVFVSALSGEGFGTVPKGSAGNMGDRNNMTLWNAGAELVNAVAHVNNNTIVVVHAVGPVTMEDWVMNANVTAVVWAGMPGSESGNSLVDVVWGDENPSGRLPYTIGKARADYPADVLYNDDAPQPQINYTEGLLVDYRWFDQKHIVPRYEFGFGLSYTNFTYANLHVKWIGDCSWRDGRSEARGESTRHACRNWNARWGHRRAPDGLPSWLFEPIYRVSFDVRNTGAADGNEVPQLYIGFAPESGEPPLVLRDFTREYLCRGASARVTFELSHYALSTWNISAQQWLRPPGNVSVAIGASSRDIRLRGEVL
ncbi:beta-glucosidase [Malassezia sp. CBS 17886]|nr:beta-glucosidase [Malassezia sp. CBS 17886]